MNHFMQGFDIVRDSPWIGLAMLITWVVLTFVYGCITNGRNPQSPVTNFYLPLLIVVPVFTLLTIWCYQHPEQLVNAPWYCDLRILWPFALAELIVIVTFYYRSRKDWFQEGMLAIERGKRLAAEGKTAESEAAFAKAKWILDHKSPRR